MKANEGLWDRIIRVILGVFLVYWGFFSGSLQGTTGLIVGIVGLIPLVTGVIGICPLYFLLKINTNK